MYLSNHTTTKGKSTKAKQTKQNISNIKKNKSLLKKGVHGLPSKVAVESGVSLSFFLAQISQYSLLQRLTRVNNPA